jgi:hypothetical protein
MHRILGFNDQLLERIPDSTEGDHAQRLQAFRDAMITLMPILATLMSMTNTGITAPHTTQTPTVATPTDGAGATAANNQDIEVVNINNDVAPLTRNGPKLLDESPPERRIRLIVEFSENNRRITVFMSVHTPFIRLMETLAERYAFNLPDMRYTFDGILYDQTPYGLEMEDNNVIVARKNHVGC